MEGILHHRAEDDARSPRNEREDDCVATANPYYAQQVSDASEPSAGTVHLTVRTPPFTYVLDSLGHICNDQTRLSFRSRFLRGCVVGHVPEMEPMDDLGDMMK